jgi:hypothetical protein
MSLFKSKPLTEKQKEELLIQGVRNFMKVVSKCELKEFFSCAVADNKSGLVWEFSVKASKHEESK